MPKLEGTWVSVEMLVPWSKDEAVHHVTSMMQRAGYEVSVEKTENGQPSTIVAAAPECITASVESG